MSLEEGELGGSLVADADEEVVEWFDGGAVGEQVFDG